MQKHILSLAMLCCLHSFATQAQSAQKDAVTAGYANPDDLSKVNNAPVIRVYNINAGTVKGSPFWYAEWMPADVTMEGQKLSKVPAKLKLWQGQELMARRPSGDSVFLPYDRIREALLYTAGGDTLLLKKIAHSENKSGELFHVLHDGQYRLLVRPERALLKANINEPYGGDRKYDELSLRAHYFIMTEGSDALQKIKRNKKSLLKVLSGKDKAMESYIKKQKLDLDKDKDLARAVAYYERLKTKLK